MVTRRLQTGPVPDDDAAEREDERRPELAEQILANSFDCVKVLDDAGIVLWINARGLELMEICDAGHVTGAPWAGFWDLSEQSLVADAVSAARAGGVGRFAGPCRTARGTLKHWDVVVTLMPADGDASRRLLVVSRDITELRLMTVQRDDLLARERRARLQAESAVRDREEALLLVTHELRGPLNAVRGWTTLLQFEGTTPEAAQGLAAIAQNAERISALVEQLNDAARMRRAGAVELVPHRIAGILQSAIDAVSPAARARRIDLRGQQFGELLVMADFHAAHRAVANLLANAIKFTPEGGSIEVRCAKQHRFVRIEIADSGAGISREFIPKLFQPFTQAGPRERRSGLGLGLSIVRDIIRAHGGSVEAFSDGPGKGATFAMTLPAAGS